MRASPVAALNRRPTSVRKYIEQGAITPRVLNVIIIIVIIIIMQLYARYTQKYEK